MPRRDIVVRELPRVADASERLLALHAQAPDAYPVFLDSAASGGPLGRFSLLLAAPGERLSLHRDGSLSGPGEGSRFCERLNAWWRADQGPAPPAPWPFAGGWFLYLGYELAAEVETTLRLPASPFELVATAWRMRAALLHDHASGSTVAIAEGEAVTELDRLEQVFVQAVPDTAVVSA